MPAFRGQAVGISVEGRVIRVVGFAGRVSSVPATGSDGVTHRQLSGKRAGLQPNRTSFMDTDICILYNFLITKYSCIDFFNYLEV